jgi:hypothetical protein
VSARKAPCAPRDRRANSFGCRLHSFGKLSGNFLREALSALGFVAALRTGGFPDRNPAVPSGYRQVSKGGTTS